MRALSALLLVSLLAGCGAGETISAAPVSVVRTWSSALNAGDNDRAANLFARDAKVVQSGAVTILHSHADAVAFNVSLPCSGRIVELDRHGEDVTATFVLADRRTSRCDGPGQRARAAFRIQRGKIVLWHQLPNAGGDDADPTV